MTKFKYKSKSTKIKEKLIWTIVCMVAIIFFLMFTTCGHKVWNWSADVVSEDPSLFNDIDTIPGDTVYFSVFGKHVPLNMHKRYKNDSVTMVEQTTDTVIIKDTVIATKVMYTDSIPFERINNAIWITIYVNDILVKGIFDTGCSVGLHLSGVEYEYFKRNGVDVGNVEKGVCIGANGIQSTIYVGKLNNVKIGNYIHNSINVSYGESNEGTNLIGIDIINNKFMIDYKAGYIFF